MRPSQRFEVSPLLKIVRTTPSHIRIRPLANIFRLAAILALATASLTANAQFAITSPAPATTEGLLSLPDSPGSVRAISTSTQPADPTASEASRSAPAAETLSKFIQPRETAPPLSSSEKVAMGFKSAFSPFAVVGWFSAAGYSHIIDSSPNYGTDRGAFGQRLGATALRATSEGILTDSVMAPIFHEDPRYYQLGPGHSIAHRLVYAATRAIITRTDDGRTTPNYALITGNVEGSILTNAYYPSRNRTVKDTAETFGGSIGGSALSFAISEFFSDTLDSVHFKNAW
jgi:hypothetical protein